MGCATPWAIQLNWGSPCCNFEVLPALRQQAQREEYKDSFASESFSSFSVAEIAAREHYDLVASGISEHHNSRGSALPIVAGPWPSCHNH